METPALSVGAKAPGETHDTIEHGEDLFKSSFNISKFEERESLLKHHKSELDFRGSVLGFESSDSHSESKHEEEPIYPYGEHYTPLTSAIIRDKKKKLGIINLYWPLLNAKYLDR